MNKTFVTSVALFTRLKRLKTASRTTLRFVNGIQATTPTPGLTLAKSLRLADQYMLGSI
jgi:hypothetical protein